MANDLNQCNFTGNLGKDPDCRATPSGTMVANFNIAVGSKWKDKNTNQPVEHVEWVRISAFNRLAEIAQQYLKKGDKVRITGQIRTRKWQDQSGQDRYSTEIVASEMQMLGGKSDQQASQGQQRAPQQSAPPQPRQQQPNQQHQAPLADDFEDDIPF